MMKVLRVFFVGFVYGLFMKYIIDEIFVRDQYRIITNENTLLRERVQELEAKVAQRIRSAPQPVQRAELPNVSTSQSEQRAESIPIPASHEARIEPSATPASQPVRSSNSKDDLKLIKGIGPQMEKKLHKAGIHTFDQMSRLTASDLQMILGISKRATQNADNLLTQARKFAKEKK